MTEPLLSVRELNAWYGESHALHGIDLDVHAGETVTLLGRNGVGKTTALRAIVGIIRKRSGTIRFDGKDMLRVPLHRTARHGIGYVPEERGIFSSLNVEENLMLPPLIKQGGMTVDAIYDLFPNLKERRRSQGTRLSGGEQQMLAIGRALMSQPRLLLLDEPSLGLAPLIVKQIFKVIEDINREQRMTVFLVEQNAFGALKIADRGYVMETGGISIAGPAEALIADPRIREAYLGI